jgi:hypothetical protein
MLGHLSKNNGHLVLWYDASGSGYTSQIKEINRSRVSIEEVIQELVKVSKTKSHEVFIWGKNMKNVRLYGKWSRNKSWYRQNKCNLVYVGI